MRTGGLVLLLSLTLAGAGPASASIDREGPRTSGANDRFATAQPLPVVKPETPATVFGWIDARDANDVDFYRFSLESPQSVYIDLDFGEDAAVSADDDVGLDAEVSVFDVFQRLIAINDDSRFFAIGPGANAGTDPGSDPWANHDPFVGALDLAAGTYFVAVAYWQNDPNALAQAGIGMVPLSDSGDAVLGAAPDATFEKSVVCVNPVGEQCVGPYQLQIRLDFAGVVDVEGDASSGQNDAAAGAQALGTLAEKNDTVTALGWIDRNDENDVDFWAFTLATDAEVFIDVDFAEDIRASADGDLGLDPEIWVFDASETLIANDDDNDFIQLPPLNQGFDPGSDPFAEHDPFIGPLPLAAGDYTVAVAYFENDASAALQGGLATTDLAASGVSIIGATPDATFQGVAACGDPVAEQCAGIYQLQVRPFFLPEPGATAGRFAAGLAVAALGAARRRLRARAA